MTHNRRFLLVVAAILTLASSLGQTQGPADGSIQLWVSREYSTWDNPLQSEVTINGQLVNIYTSDKMDPIGKYLRDGWNVVSVKTAPQEPASKNNSLIFRIGPAHKSPAGNDMVMGPVLWEFRNGTDWKFDQGKYSHPLGPGTKDVTLAYNLYFAGLKNEVPELKAGDYILVGKAEYSTWNSPVTGTVFINGTPLNSFTTAERQIVITSLLKPGRNEIKLVSARVKNSVKDNDVAFEILGPAQWNVSEAKFMVAPVVQFKAKQGWTLEPRTGLLINRTQPASETIERIIPFVMKQ